MNSRTVPAPKAYNTSALHRHIDQMDQQFRELRGSASMLYRKLIEINFRYGMSVTFFITNTELMAITGFCWRTLRRAKQLLTRMGMIRVEASAGRGKATVYSLRPPKDFGAQPAEKQASQPTIQQPEAPALESQDQPASAGTTTIEELRSVTCANPQKYNYEGFIRKMEAFKPSPTELYELTHLANFGQIGGKFWTLCAEIERQRSTSYPIKSPVKYLLKNLKAE